MKSGRSGDHWMKPPAHKVIPFRLMEALDKGKAAAVTTIVETRDQHSGKVIFENQMTVFIRGAGGFGGRRAGKGAVAFMKTRMKKKKKKKRLELFIQSGFRSWCCFCCQRSATPSSGCCH